MLVRSIKDENNITPYDLAQKLRLDSSIFISLNKAVLAVRSREEVVLVDVDVDDAANSLPNV